MRKKILAIVCIYVFTVMIVRFMSLTVAARSIGEEATQGVVSAASEYFPIITINLPFSPFIERGIWQNGKISLLNAPEEHSFQAAARVRGRGNSTWYMGENKRPLRIRFDEARSMLGSAYEARNWILLADNFDRSLMRNYSAFKLAEAMGMGFVPSAQHVHLYVNSRYMGVYLLTDERDVISGRVEIESHPQPERSGFFIELDGRASEPYVTVNDLRYGVLYPSGRQLTPAHVDYVRDYLERVSHAIRFGSFDEILRLVDLDTLVDFYIVQELYKNMDVYAYSVFMYISGEGGERRLFMGPVWDFDIAAGNSAIQVMGSGSDGLYVAVFNYWYRNLMERPEFFDAVAARWSEIRHEQVAKTINLIKETAAKHRFHFERNFTRHPEPLPFLREEMRTNNSFMSQTKILTDWLEARADWLDGFFSGKIEYSHMWALVEYFRTEAPVQVVRNGEPLELTLPPIRLPYAVKINMHEYNSIFGLSARIGADGVISLTNADTTITHTLGTNTFYVNGEAVESSAPSINIRGYNFIPLRVIAEIMGYEIEWDEVGRVVGLVG
ncbi:MAG: CotH kinase family protein [Defluviitaleaceae bacterium]|nr:CotH kinase family protein [Defluviitaleaceae bacterium]